MMAVAFGAGRGVHEEDRILKEAPENIRRHLMLIPNMRYRNTRDRSFLVHSLGDSPKTEPFFYPLVPWLASGLETVLPGYGRDALMPLFGLLFITALVCLGRQFGQYWGMAVALTFVLGCPLPLWLYRGFYIEAAGMTVLVGSAWAWTQGHSKWGAFFAGLSASFHPVFLIPGSLLLVMMLLGRGKGFVDTFRLALFFLLGLLPLVAMTIWVCAPYGQLDIQHIRSLLQVSTVHQLMFAGGLGVSGLLLVFSSIPKAGQWIRKGLQDARVRVGLTVLAFLPLLLTAFLWSEGGRVERGLEEFALAIRWPLGCLALVGIVQVHGTRIRAVFFCFWLIFVCTLPLFAYLKGLEQVGMWSQRRLFPAYGLLCLALIPAISQRVQDWVTGSLIRIRAGIAVVVLSCAAFANPIRWPAPYWVQVEKGALEEVQDLQTEIGGRLAFFDYLPYSFPFAVTNRTRALGLNEESHRHLPEIVSWLAEKSRQEEVWWFTAYANPGLEDGVRLNEIRKIEFPLDRINAKQALPAERKSITISMTVLEALPVQAEGDLAVDKVLDGGPLALRGIWGNYRRSLKTESGERVPAEWTRKRSGIIGPMPSPGSGVRLTLWAASGRDVPQQVTVIPPWPDTEVDIEIPSAFGKVELWLPAPHEGTIEDEDYTGTYTFFIPNPYDPSAEGIRGFANDLGFICHRIRVERASGL
jgi:hypothetical protein